MKDRWSLDRVPYVWSWWKFYQRMLPIIWSQHQVSQNPLCLSRLQEETFWKGGVLTGSHSFDPNTRSIKIIPVLQDSRKKLRGEVESWRGFWCWILMKISQKLHKDAPFYLSPMPGGSGSSMSSKTPGRDLEECLIRMLLFTWLQSGTFMSSRKRHVEKDIDSTIYKLCEAKPTVSVSKIRRSTLKCQNTPLKGAETKIDDSILLPVKSSYIFW